MARLGPSGLAQLFREIANYVSTRLSDYKTKAELDSLLDTKADDNNVIHRSGDETIDGVKTFTASPFVSNYAVTNGFFTKHNHIARNEVPSQIYHSAFRVFDKNAKTLGEYCVEKSTSGSSLLHMDVHTEDSEGNDIMESVYLNLSNDGSTVSFHPAKNNRTDLGTPHYKWAKIYSDDVVHTSGDETIDGNKYFTQDVNVKNSDVDIAVTPSNNLFSCFRFRGKGNVTTASIQYSQRTYGVNDICFYVFDASSNSHGFRIRTDNRLEPIVNNTYSLGSSSSKWADVYSTNAYIDRVVCTRFTHSVNNGSVYITGGSEYDKGATLALNGEESSDAGSFVISSRDKTRTLYLVGKPDGTLQWAGQNIALDENLVHTTGNEHISGTKMFSNTIHRYADLTTSTVETVYRFDDTNANACGHIYNNVHWHNNAVFNRHGAYNAKSGKTIEIDIISRDSGEGTAYVTGTASKGNLETVTSATGHTAIATMGWVNNPATSTNVVHRSGDETIDGTKTFSNRLISNKELHYKDTQYDWTDTSLNTWCDAGHVAWHDKTGNRRMHELVGAKNGVWRKVCYINENEYFSVDSNRNISYRGTAIFNGYTIFNQDMIFKNNNIDLTVTPANTLYSNFIFTDKNDQNLSYIQYAKRNTDPDVLGLYINDKDKNLHGIQITSNNYLLPMGNNIWNLGSPGNKWANVYATTFNGNSIKFPSDYYITTYANDNSLRIIRHGTNHGNNYKIIIQGDTGKIFAPNGFQGNLEGNANTATSATSATKASYLDNYSVPGMNKIYLDWDTQRKGYVGLKVDQTVMGGLITTSNLSSQKDTLCSTFANAIRFGGVGCIKLLAFEWDGYNTSAYSLQEGTSFSGANLRHVVMSLSGTSTIPSGSDTIGKGLSQIYLGTRPTGTWSLLGAFGAVNRSYHPNTCVGLFVRIA